MDIPRLKLILKKAIFAGTTFVRHSEDIGAMIDPKTDDELIEVFEGDEDLFQLLDDWEELRKKLGIEV